MGDDRYEFVTTLPDGIEQIEEFTDASVMAERQKAMQRDLVAEGWSGPHGWNI